MHEKMSRDRANAQRRDWIERYMEATKRSRREALTVSRCLLDRATTIAASSNGQANGEINQVLLDLALDNARKGMSALEILMATPTTWGSVVAHITTVIPDVQLGEFDRRAMATDYRTLQQRTFQ